MMVGYENSLVDETTAKGYHGTIDMMASPDYKQLLLQVRNITSSVGELPLSHTFLGFEEA